MAAYKPIDSNINKSCIEWTNYLLAGMKSGYALVKFPLWAWGFRPVAPIALTLKTIWLARKLLLLLRVFSKIFLALQVFKRSDWTILVICYLLSLNYCHGALLAEGDLQSWASKSLVGRTHSDTRSAFRWCGVATKLSLQTFVFNWQKKIRVYWRLIRWYLRWWRSCEIITSNTPT